MPLSRQEEFFVQEFSEEQVSIATTTEFSNHPADVSTDDLSNQRRTSSRNSKRESEEAAAVRQPPSTAAGSSAAAAASHSTDHEFQDLEQPHDEDEVVFVKPTKPAPKKANKTHKKQRESIAEESDSELSSSFEDLVKECSDFGQVSVDEDEEIPSNDNST